MSTSEFVNAFLQGGLQSQSGATSGPKTSMPRSQRPVTLAKDTPWYRRVWFDILLLTFVPYVQVPLMWFQKMFPVPVRIILTGVGVFLTVGMLSFHSPDSTTPSSSGSTQATADDASVSEPSDWTAGSYEDWAHKLRGLSVAGAKEYGRTTAHAEFKDLRAASLRAIEPTNELHRLRGEREETADEIKRMIIAIPLPPDLRSKTAEEAAKAGVPVEVRNAFFDGWDMGENEARGGIRDSDPSGQGRR